MYTIERVSEILVPRDQINFPRPRKMSPIKGHQDIANSRNGIFLCFIIPNDLVNQVFG